MAGKVTVRGQETVIRNMEMLTPQIIMRADAANEKAGIVLNETMAEEAGKTDHDLAQLAEMGHPYSTRYGPDSGPHPDEIVHIQSGLLWENIEKIVKRTGNRMLVACGVRRAKVPYIDYLVNGTTKMRPRDFAGHAWLNCKDVVIGIVKHGLALGSRRGIYGNRSKKVA